MYRIFAVNPGSTSTKVALFEDEKEIFIENIQLEPEVMKTFKGVQDQLEYRRDQVEAVLRQKGYSLADIDIFSARGGGLVPLDGGIYELNDKLVEDASNCATGAHPAQLASQICKQFADRYGKKAYTVSPPDMDEMDLISRVTGVKGIYRESKGHPLNQKEVAYRYGKSIDRKYEDLNLVISHIGGGISVTAHRKGKMVDTNSTMKGEGPMSPTRAGTLPYIKAIELAYKYPNQDDLVSKLNRNSGFLDHLGTDDTREVEKRIAAGDEYAKIVYDAMIYQIAKYIGYFSVTLKGQVDAILLTGGMAKSAYLTDKIKEYCGWIAPIVIFAGEFEMEALASGALRIARGEEQPKTYTGIPVWSGFEGIETL